MGKHFGELYKIHGITYFRLSPYEQKPFVGMISDGLPNLVRRFNGSVLRIAPFAIFCYSLIKWANEENHKLSRKNPADFANDT